MAVRVSSPEDELLDSGETVTVSEPLAPLEVVAGDALDVDSFATRAIPEVCSSTRLASAFRLVSRAEVLFVAWELREAVEALVLVGCVVASGGAAGITGAR